MPNKITQLCLLAGHSSVENSLLGFNISKSQIKKQKLSKKFLEKKIEEHQEIEIPLDLLNRGLIYPKYEGPKIEILFEDDLILCLNKPPNVHCHPLRYDESNNVLSFLRENLYFKKTNFCFERNYEGGLLYRLDFETSGILFLTKNKKEYEKIRKEFQNFAKKKEYICLVKGDFQIPGVYKHFLSSYGENKSKVRVKENGELGEGKIEINKMKYNRDKDISLLKVVLFSGIRHQIRAQLSHLGFPILGDILYGGEKSDRLFLHAFRYEMKINERDYKVEARDAFLFDSFFNLDSIL